ncbi:MAG: sigma-54-dependent Fis family transcriptional regulator [Acidobacteria bacterium]|nr:sigma-54-dependent Fis family transcriptional regulator [Acidobacteriota bacterium]
MARVLVVDDEEGLREFIGEALSDVGHAVTLAGDGLEALDQLKGQAFDLMLTDLKMPRLDGIELLRRVRGETPGMEVLVLTAHGSVDTAVEAMKLGALDYLEKPIHSPEELRLVVAKALEHRGLRSFREQSLRIAEGAPRLSYGDPVMEPVEEAIRKVAPTLATVLLLGESGTGKEVAARAIHQASGRRDAPFVAINCAAVSDHLLESELFGHERGAFTGADKVRRGRIELAEGGTFFLDEIGELKLELQAKLLRVLQERRYERVGGTRTFEADVRWIAATNRDLPEMLRAGTFREDLYHRLAVFPIRLPALRERRRDIGPLAEALLDRIRASLGRSAPLRLSKPARAELEAGAWPGNIRELSNALERAAILADGEALEPRHLVAVERAPSATPAGGTLAEVERELIRRVLAEEGGHRQRTAERLGIGLRTLYEKLKRYELE